MMRYFFIVIVLYCNNAFCQSSSQVWTELGLEGSISSKMNWGAEFNTRFSNNGLETLFPQVSLEYKVSKWFRPSIDYRYFADRKNAGYYAYGHRLNINGNFRYGIERLKLKARIRYQYAFNNLFGAGQYEPEFDNSLRLRLAAEYDVNDFFLTPVINGEIFYNPNFGEFGRQINKLRLYAGLKSDLSGPHSFSIGYLYDTRINMSPPRMRHVLNLGYTYKFGAND